MIIHDKQLAINLKKVIKEKEYPLGFVCPSSSNKNKYYLLFFNTNSSQRCINKITVSIKPKNDVNYFKFISKDMVMKMTEDKFKNYIEQKCEIGLVNDCSSNDQEAVNFSDEEVENVRNYFYWFSNRRLNDERFDSLCKRIFGIKFDLRNGCGHADIVKIDDKNNLYLLVQNFGNMGGFSAIVSGSQIKKFMLEYDKLVKQTEKTTYQQIAEKLPQLQVSEKQTPKNVTETEMPVSTKEEVHSQVLAVDNFEELLSVSKMQL